MLNPQAWGLGGGMLAVPSGFGLNGPCYDPATLALITTAASTAASYAGTIGTIATVAGTGLSAMGTLASGKAAQQAANYQAAQLDMKGKDELAQGQQEAEQYRRKKQLALSTLQSRAAASGFEATDPTNLKLAEDITEHGELQEGLAMYGGKSRREGLEAQARGKRFEGKAERIGSYYKAGATILGGVASIADKYAPRPKSKSDYLYG
jgi:hypothetical protein